MEARTWPHPIKKNRPDIFKVTSLLSSLGHLPFTFLVTSLLSDPSIVSKHYVTFTSLSNIRWYIFRWPKDTLNITGDIMRTLPILINAFANMIGQYQASAERNGLVTERCRSRSFLGNRRQQWCWWLNIRLVSHKSWREKYDFWFRFCFSIWLRYRSHESAWWRSGKNI